MAAKKIIISKIFKDDYITRAAGERLRVMIEQADRDNCMIDLVFTAIKVGSTSFFDEGIAKLKDLGWDRNRLEKHVRFVGLSKSDQKILDAVCSLRKFSR